MEHGLPLDTKTLSIWGTMLWVLDLEGKIQWRTILQEIEGLQGLHFPYEQTKGNYGVLEE